jgi:hypothetical protein
MNQRPNPAAANGFAVAELWSLSQEMLLRTIILPLLIAMALPAYSQDANATKSGFWPWFESRQSEFAKLFSYQTGAAAQNDPKLQKKIEDTIGEVADKLRKVHPEFSPFFGFSDGANKMIVTVHGQTEHFKPVDAFIASAPKIDGWKFIALKQPLSLGADTEIQSGSAKLKVGDWRYAKTKNSDGAFDFVIYVSNKVSDDPEGFKRLFTRLTMDFLGERFASIAVGAVTVRELTVDAPEGLLPFVDIYKDVSHEVNKG